MNKKGFLTRDVVITAIVFTGLIALFVLMVGSVSSNYDRPDMTSDSFSENYDKLEDLSNDIEISRAESSTGRGFSLVGTFDVLFNSVFTVIGLVFNTLDLYGNMVSNIISDFPFLDSTVVKIFGVILLSLLTTVVIFVWMSSISKGKI